MVYMRFLLPPRAVEDSPISDVKKPFSSSLVKAECTAPIDTAREVCDSNSSAILKAYASLSRMPARSKITSSNSPSLVSINLFLYCRTSLRIQRPFVLHFRINIFLNDFQDAEIQPSD